MDDSSGQPPDPGPLPEERQERRARWNLAGLLLALFVALLLYRVLHAGHLEETTLFYVGLPAVIAITVVLASKPRSATGSVVATVTVALAFAGPLLGEGIVCVLFAAPLFLLVALLIGSVIDYFSRRGPHAVVAPLVLLTLVTVGAELAGPARETEVTVVRAATATGTEQALAAVPVFGPFESVFLRMGFPRPLAATGTGLEVGAVREITFNPRRSLGIGAVPEPRSMTLRVKERGPGRVTFSVVRDTTLARWLDLREAEFSWGSGKLAVTLRYRRTFDPGWYFGPLQRYAVGQAADYLAGTFAR
ncbi:hypothetical protein [Streptosporangium saharense]|uniref:Uncharacterized protein n=1 Tax=Streptosporangium saharense TaxID=1706840 RepID=A0A7W7QNK8_9ACTN|nr:hypothetical protein [Streptosporangium saharense]MBB4916850.1 hypothetical protein [Streptosporangium saharense]